MTWQEKVIKWGNRFFFCVAVLLAMRLCFVEGEKYAAGPSTLENYNEQR